MAKTILIIEDNADNLLLINQILEYSGFKTEQSKLAEEGIARLHKGGIDLVLMDISLPKMDGIEATKIIKADAALKNIPVIGLSAHAFDSEKKAALDAGFDDYHTKPIDEDLLLIAINNILE